MMTLILSAEYRNIKFSIYGKGTKFILFVGGISRARYATLKGAQGAMNRIIKAN